MAAGRRRCRPIGWPVVSIRSSASRTGSSSRSSSERLGNAGAWPLAARGGGPWRIQSMEGRSTGSRGVRTTLSRVVAGEQESPVAQQFASLIA